MPFRKPPCCKCQESIKPDCSLQSLDNSYIKTQDNFGTCVSEGPNLNETTRISKIRQFEFQNMLLNSI